MPEKKKMSRKAKVLIIIAAAVVVICAAFGIYLSMYYHAEPEAEAAMESTADVAVEQLSSDEVAFIPDDPVAGLIYYPGGNVEYTAYAPLMQECAEHGILCVLVKMPFNLAFFDVNAADDVYDRFPEIDNWYIGGHSLGGVAAGLYAEDNADRLDGIIFTGSYTTSDLTESGLPVLYIYGSEDQVVGMSDYQEYRANLPDDTEEYVIEGGCHAGFGDYGAQMGDGTPSITGEEQRTIAAACIAGFIN